MLKGQERTAYNRDESHKADTGWKKPDPKECILQNAICIKYKNSPN